MKRRVSQKYPGIPCAKFLMEYHFVIPGRPVPAPRMTNKSKFVRPEALRYLEYKEKIGWFAQKSGVTKIDTDIEVECRFFINGGREPDIDKLVKAILDGLNGIAWSDDSKVRRIIAEKLGSKTEYAEVMIREYQLQNR
ncbi:RusA family crossover junction endodeoxyribonuclease [Fervidicola ferrireducens]|nr:RusA family crossover junction endodeoxyribonuclease [Fervidicola ferrireducens]